MSANIASLFRKDQLLTLEDGELYEKAIQRWSDTAIRRAKYIVPAETAEDVSKAQTRSGEKGGGHSCSGASSSEGGLVIDLSRMNKCIVDLERKTIKVGGGALWLDVATEAAKYGMATLTPRYGLVIDILEEAELVTANRDILTCNEAEKLRSILGYSRCWIELRSCDFLHPQYIPTAESDMVRSARLPATTPPLLTPLFDAAAKWAKTASVDESAMIFMACPPPAFTPMLVVIPFYNGSAEEAKKKFAPFFDVGPVADMTQEMPYSEVNGLQNPMAMYGGRKLFKSTAFTAVNAERFQHIFENYVKLTDELPETKAGAIIVELHPFDKVADVPESATAFANRGKWYNINCALRWSDPALDKRVRAWASEQVEYLRDEEAKEQGMQLSGRRGYGNYGVEDEKIREVFGGNFDRLALLKGKYDPENIFHKWFAIPLRA
ncbi:Glucooligosaccharide oxidase [Calocera cornea HHB12733]|uniref:Glucooligosaccharide oxidase n=1 Tax=Calocera cornea HHB12733 TaxID=1353952 RepID=A0A165C3C5_9BASI|nr:Glucooligosaccharide oxidase [Calocera cornea HHB12733]